MIASLFTSIAVAVALPFLLSGKQFQAAEEKARERRMREHRLNARLVSMNL